MWYSTPLSTLPFDLLAIQFILPRVMEYIVPGEFSKRAVMTWWHIVAKPLRLSSFMFGEIGPETPTNGHLAQVPAYDHVPYVRHRSMVVPVDPQSLAPLDETDRLLGHPAGSGVGQTMIVYIPPFFKIRVAVFLLLVWITGSILVCSMSFVPCKLLVSKRKRCFKFSHSFSITWKAYICSVIKYPKHCSWCLFFCYWCLYNDIFELFVKYNFTKMHVASSAPIHDR